MDVYESDDYKAVLRQELSERRKDKASLSLKSIASRIPIQYTYLSKALNDEKTHLNEDHLFAFCRFLELVPEETEFLFLLRSRALATSSARKLHLDGKIAATRRARQLNAEVAAFHREQWAAEVDYLLDAVTVVVHVALAVPEYAQNPRRLCAPLGISPKRLQEVLEKLRRLGLVEMGIGGAVEKVAKERIHYSAEHPLMRTHQSVLRTLSASQLARLDESEKHSFMVTFTGDETARAAIRAAFQSFVGEVEKIATAAPAKKTYQMNFDLFSWG